jgi:hypothetical protein
MKRKNRISKFVDKVVKKESLPNRWWPTIFCLHEKIFIGLSLSNIKVAGGVPLSKVDYSQWKKENSRFREGYEIDMTKYAEGEIVHCPHCGSKVDFRLWKSATIPEFLPVSINNVLYGKKDDLG